ncbi:hypothetical protein B0J14DRAFT_603050, partial [Halenospora varia]
MQLLPIIAWVINTSYSQALPRNTTPYEVWYGRKPPTWPTLNKEETRRSRSRGSEDLIESASSEEGSQEGKGIAEGEELEEDLFVDEDAVEEEEQEPGLLSELTKRVAEHMKKQQENVVKRVNAAAL